MARTYVAVVMCTVYTMSSCYNKTTMGQENRSEQVNTTRLYPVNITIEDLKQQETKTNKENALVLNVQENKKNINSISVTQGNTKNKINIIHENKDNNENNINIVQEKMQENVIKNVNKINTNQQERNTNKDFDLSLEDKHNLKAHESEMLRNHNYNEEPMLVDKNKKKYHDGNKIEEIIISDDKTGDEKEISNERSTKTTDPNFFKHEITKWSLESNYSENNNEKENITDSKEELKKIVKEFRPSPHLDSFYDEGAFALTTQPSTAPWSPSFTKPSSFISTPQDFYKFSYTKPIDAPYKFETNVFHDPTYWKHHNGLESRPTDTAPVKIAAGGLYKSPDVFKGRPTIDSEEEFGLKFKDEPKENSIKKGVSPWKSFLHLATALLPVGLIVSALTPSVITLQSTDNSPLYPHRVTRRVGRSQRLPHVSEECKRRLLCELHSHSVHQQITPPGYKHCYKIQCEHPEAMMKVLHWVLAHHPTPHPSDRGNIT